MRNFQSFDDLINLYTRERTPSKAMVQQLGVVTRSFRQFAKVHHLDDIQRNHLLEWKQHLLNERQVTVTSYNNYLRHFKTLLNFAGEMGWDGTVVMKGIRRLPEHKKKKRTLTNESVQKIIGYLHQPQQHNMPGWFWEAVVKTLYYTGMRRRQLVGLCWGDIDRQHSTIMLRAENSKTREEWSIPVAPPLQAVFDELARLTQARLGRMFRTDEQVFNLPLFKSGYKGKVMTVEHVSAAFRRIRENTGIEVSPHRFRHTFATKLAKQGKIRDLQQMMGHSDVRTTLGYVQPDLNNMRQMLGGLGEI
ncbi:tyrosine-type recombinase/integrase [Thiothrix subterranea]|uniref:Tyrosine-type recombinase/integrase n=1 Tax=Thiothrix subterranea TaxID=2735563 RepID=A0AA51R4I1_9GAMM|nr:tyrosine-type recombinase/integrase [Thiothrix subterranea]MDQ5767881.1 tyrosine-type recombinase/integrase [Thiothrix subterranea]WML86660.1 tyrosine-type recombinase/integrase [Thiothrix subterranea]